MRHYERYLFMHMLLPAILVTGGLTGIVWLTQVMRFIDFMLNRGLTIADFLYLTGLMLPNLLMIMIPLALGIGVVYAYNRLTSDSELVVLSAVGVSKLQLARPAILVGVLAMLFCYALGMFLMPLANQKFRDVRTFFRDKYASVLLEEEVFNTPIDGMTVFVRQRDSHNNLFGILLQDNRKPDSVVTMMADRGRMEQGASGPRFYLEHGIRQELKDGHVSWLSFDNYTIDIAFYGKDVARDREPDEMSLSDLLKGDPTNAKENNALHAEAHQRILWPMFCIALPLLGVATLLAGEFNRRGQWKRTVQAAAAIILVMVLFFIMRNVVLTQPMLTPLLYLLVAGSIGASVRMLVSGHLWWARAPQSIPLVQS